MPIEQVSGLTARMKEAIAAEYFGISITRVRELRSKVRELAGPDVHAKLLGLAICECLADVAKSRVYTQGTIRTYTSELTYFGRFMEDHAPGINLHEVTASHIQAWLAQPPQRRQQSGLRDESGNRRLARTTWDKKIRALRALMRYGKRYKWVQSDPTLRLDKPERRGHNAPRAFSEREYGRLLGGANRGRHARRNVLMLRIMGECGLRISALIRLRAVDVVLNPTDGNPAHIVISRNKGGDPAVTLIFPPLVPALEDYLAENDLLEHPSHFLFHRPGNPEKELTTRQVTKVFDAALVEAKLSNLAMRPTPHSLRHTYGHRLKRAGVQLDDIRILMNHQALSATQVYTLSTLQEIHEDVLRYLPMRRSAA